MSEQFEHCAHEIRCERIVTITGAVRTRWRCRNCRAQGIVDLPTADRDALVTPSFVVALSEAALAAMVKPPRPPVRPMSRGLTDNQRKALLRVYAIRNERSGLIKIGISGDPIVRLANIQTSTHEKLSLLAAIPGTATTERELHHKFRTARVHGEWFLPTPAVLAWVEEAKRA